MKQNQNLKLMLLAHALLTIGSTGVSVAAIASDDSDTGTYGSNQQCLQASAQRPAEFGIEMAFKF